MRNQTLFERKEDFREENTALIQSLRRDLGLDALDV